MKLEQSIIVLLKIYIGSAKYLFFFFGKCFKKVLRIFWNFFSYLKVQSFRLIMENNFIQMAALAGHAVAYMIDTIYEISEMFNCWERRRIALHTHFLPQQQYSRVYATFLAFHTLVYRWHFFHNITNIRSWRCFSSSKIRTQFSLILQQYHDF